MSYLYEEYDQSLFRQRFENMGRVNHFGYDGLDSLFDYLEDFAEIAYCPDDLEKAWGNKPDQNELSKTFDRLFWDAPIYACFTINGEEYRYDEDMPDSYKWDKEAWAKIVSDKSNVPLETLLSMLPKTPDYN